MHCARKVPKNSRFEEALRHEVLHHISTTENASRSHGLPRRQTVGNVEAGSHREGMTR